MTFLFLIALFSTFFGSLGTLFLKLGADKISLSATGILTNYNIWLGVLLYIFASVLFLTALQDVELSYLYPITGLTYVWVAFLSTTYLGETIGISQRTGILLILIGVSLVSL